MAKLRKDKNLVMRKKSLLLSALSLLPLIASAACAQDVTYSLVVPKDVQSFISNRCIDCHGEDGGEGDVRLDNLSSLENDARLELMNKVQEQLFLEQMPPEDEEQPTAVERARLTDWVSKELHKHNASRLEDKLRFYKYANYLNHDKLFSGESKEKPFTKARRWRVNELIYHERINEVFELEGRNRQNLFFGVVKPFNLPKGPGVSYYDTEIVEGGQFLTLMANAKWIVDKQLRAALLVSGEYQHPTANAH